MSYIMNKDLKYTTQFNEIGKGTIVSAFKKRVQMTPDAIAVVYNDRQYTFKQVDQISNGIACKLIQNGMNKGDIIGIRITRSELFMILPLAILKIGCVFVPLDLTWPDNQLMDIVDIANIKLILTDINNYNELNNLVSFYFDTTSLIEYICCDTSISFPIIHPEDTMCIFFTSGSTGTPKGVIHRHSSVFYMIVSGCYENKLNSKDVLLYYMNFGFLFGHRIFQSIIAGVPLHIAPQYILQNFPALNNYIEKNKITSTIMPTQVAYLFSKSASNSSLRLLEIGGSAVPEFDTMLSYCIVSAYGSTECLAAFNVVVTPGTSKSLIGLPSIYTDYILLNENGISKKPLVSGELLVTGPGLCVGYIANPNLTKEKFITINNKKYYRTGDFVKINKDGSLSFLYRIDDMVKIHGLRIELEEISSSLMDYPNILQVYTCVKSNQQVENLCSYYTTLDSHPIPSEILSQFLSDRIQTYKIPDYFIHIKTFPISERGKINKSELPEPAIIDNDYATPINDIERELADYYAEILDLKSPIGRNDNFIYLGGDSLGQMMLVGKLYSLGYDVDFGTIKSFPVIKDLATHLSKRNDTFKRESNTGFVIANCLLEDALLNNIEDNINQFNVADIYLLRERADMKKIRATLNILVQKHMMLRANVSGNKLFVNKYIENQNFELDEITTKDDGNDILKQISIFDRNKDVFSKCVLSALLIHTPTNDYLYLSCSHCVSDAVSKRIIAEDFCKIYDCVNMDKTSCIDSLNNLEHNTYLDYSTCIKRLAQSDYCKLQLNYWNAVVEKLSTAVLTKNDVNSTYKTTYKYSKFSISKEESEKLIAKNFSLADIVSAFSRTINDIYQVNCFPINLVHHGREVFMIGDGTKHYLSLERTVGCFPYTYPIVIDVGENALNINSNEIQEIINNIPDNGLIYSILKSSNRFPKCHPVFCIDFIGRYYHATDNETILQKTNRIVLENVVDSTNYQSECFVYCMVYDSKIKVIFRYDINQFSDSIIQQIQTQFKDELLLLGK